MEDIFKLEQKIVPEIMDLLEKRYNILKNIYYNQPIGRRILARNLEISERIVRTEITFLKEQNFIEITVPGMIVTSEGEEIINKLKTFIHDMRGLSELEKNLKRLLKIKHVIIVPGDSEKDSTVLSEIGKAGANYLRRVISKDCIIALTGGSTVKSTVDNMSKMNNLENIVVVPARGGMGRNVETQANTLVSNLANKVNANYKLLHVPDNLSEEAIHTMVKEKGIKEILDTIYDADILIYGVGRADDMARRRELSFCQKESLNKKGAVGEAFGYYFNREGKEVYSTPTMGIDNNKIKSIKHLIAVTGGKSKSEAIISTELNNENGVLVTDEAAAREIIKLFKEL